MERSVALVFATTSILRGGATPVNFPEHAKAHPKRAFDGDAMCATQLRGFVARGWWLVLVAGCSSQPVWLPVAYQPYRPRVTDYFLER